jgi:pimeloyl-CoA synthetase
MVVVSIPLVKYKRCIRLCTGQWFSLGTPVTSANKTDCHNITEILLKRHHSKSRIYFIDQKELHHRNKKVEVKSYLIKTKSSGHFR